MATSILCPDFMAVIENMENREKNKTK